VTATLSLPLLPAQRSKHEAWRSDPDGSGHLIVAHMAVLGDVDPVALRRALGRIISAQPSLRTTFACGLDGQPRQFVHEQVGLDLVTTDARQDADPRRTAERLTMALLECPLDLSRLPLVRGLLVRVADAEHAFVLALPGILTDGWSMALLLDLLQDQLRLLTEGREPGLGDLTQAYATACTARDDRRAGEAAATRYAQWLAGYPPLRLPVGSARSNGGPDSDRGAEIRMELDARQVEALSAAARSYRTTPTPLLLAATSSAMADYAGQDRFLINTFVVGRRLPDEAQLIGRFAKMLPLPIDLTGRPAPEKLVQRVSNAWWTGYEHHESTLPEVAVCLGHRAPPGRNPLSDVSFVMNVEETHRSPATHGPRFVRVRREAAVSPQDVTVFAGPSAGGSYELRLEHRSDIMPRDRAQNLLMACAKVLACLSRRTAPLAMRAGEPGLAQP